VGFLVESVVPGDVEAASRVELCRVGEDSCEQVVNVVRLDIE
jgi:hypothetical protein